MHPAWCGRSAIRLKTLSCNAVGRRAGGRTKRYAAVSFEQELNETRPFPVAPLSRSTRPQRYAVAARCRHRFGRFLRSVLARRLPGTRYCVAEALDVVSVAEAGEPLALKCTAALAKVGITLGAVQGTNSEAGPELQVAIDPRALRAAYPASPRLEPHNFVFTFSFDTAISSEEGSESGNGNSDLKPWGYGESRYGGGLCDRDELRMQVEVLRQPLGDLGISIDEGLDELCAGLQSPCAEAHARCNRIVRALESCGLSFHAGQRSWRLPRAGVLLIDQPDALVRSHPSLSFFEPYRFGALAIVDRTNRAGNEVRQGLLF